MKVSIVIFDGLCGLCNTSIDILIKMDKKKRFKYTSLQGEYVKKLDIGEGIDSIVFYDDGELYYKSTAIIKILKNLGGVWVLGNVFYIIPTFIRDYFYDIIAKYRYKFFGKMESCRIPEAGEEERFID